MNRDLWNLYLELQTRHAYGDGHAVPDSPENDAAIEAYYPDWLPQTPGNALIIGPGGPGEVRLWKARGHRLTVLTAHPHEAEVLRRRYEPEVQVYCNDIHDMPFAHGIFDSVAAFNVLEHSLAPYIALLECRRVLRYRGTAVFSLPSFSGAEGGRGPFHLHCLTEEVWTELLTKVGLPPERQMIEPGGVDKTAFYINYTCRAERPPEPHCTILRDIMEYKSHGRP